ncbi:MAG TPA: cupin domain-containing protein, partial [Gemmataceae bacterium]|nr:cupin domain-containing protein [Gemmataceae bacterium]
MFRTLLVLAAGIGVGVGVMNAAHHDHGDGERVRELSATDIKEKLDGKDARATVVEVIIEPGQAGVPHRHPGPAFVYVVEGEWETGLDDKPT